MIRIISGAMLALALAAPAMTQPVEQAQGSDRVQPKPIADARARYEHADQDALGADALTLRLRAGIEARYGLFILLAKYAEYEASGFGVDTRGFWLQAEWAF